MCEACPTMINHNEQPQFGQLIHTTAVRIVWVTLPGADRSYALSEEQARQLFRELEEVV